MQAGKRERNGEENGREPLRIYECNTLCENASANTTASTSMRESECVCAYMCKRCARFLFWFPAVEWKKTHITHTHTHTFTHHSNWEDDGM